MKKDEIIKNTRTILINPKILSYLSAGSKIMVHKTVLTDNIEECIMVCICLSNPNEAELPILYFEDSGLFLSEKDLNDSGYSMDADTLEALLCNWFSENPLISMNLWCDDCWISEEIHISDTGKITRSSKHNSVSIGRDYNGKKIIGLWPTKSPDNYLVSKTKTDYSVVTEISHIRDIYIPTEDEAELFYKTSGKTPSKKT